MDSEDWCPLQAADHLITGSPLGNEAASLFSSLNCQARTTVIIFNKSSSKTMSLLLWWSEWNAAANKTGVIVIQIRQLFWFFHLQKRWDSLNVDWCLSLIAYWNNTLGVWVKLWGALDHVLNIRELFAAVHSDWIFKNSLASSGQRKQSLCGFACSTWIRWLLFWGFPSTRHIHLPFSHVIPE